MTIDLNHPMIQSARKQFYFTKEEIKQGTPSRFSEITYEDEKVSRYRGNYLIQLIGERLQVTQSVIATASTYFHRFYIRKDLAKFDVYEIAASCFFIACKNEEQVRRAEDVSYEVLRFFKKQYNVYYNQEDKEVGKWAQKIYKSQIGILHTNCFLFVVELPQSHFINFLEKIECSKQLIKDSWKTITDSFKTLLCVVYTPDTVAAICLYYSWKRMDNPDNLPENWFETLNVDFGSVKSGEEYLEDLYTNLVSCL